MSNSSQLEEIYVSAARHVLLEGMRKIEHCVGQLNDEQIWSRPRPEMNSIANLILHLSGNVRQWIVSGAAGTADVRNRPMEFADRSNRPMGEVLSILKKTVEQADAAMRELNPDALVSSRRIQGYNTTVAAAIFDCIAHFRGHVQEIIHMTRQQLGEKYRFDFVPKGNEQESAGGIAI